MIIKNKNSELAKEWYKLLNGLHEKKRGISPKFS